jgi:hypothetical protein
MRRVVTGIVLGAVLTMGWTPAGATDQTIAGTIHIIKTGKLAKVVCAGVSITLPSDPTVGGASLRIKDTGGASLTNTYGLPAANWKGLGNPAGSKGFKYKGTKTPGDPCVVVLVKTNLMKGVCKGADVTTATPAFSGASAVTLTSGTDRICAQFGGTTVKNVAGSLKRKTAPAPGTCASPSGAFLDAASLF